MQSMQTREQRYSSVSTECQLQKCLIADGTLVDVREANVLEGWACTKDVQEIIP